MFTSQCFVSTGDVSPTSATSETVLHQVLYHLDYFTSVLGFLTVKEMFKLFPRLSTQHQGFLLHGQNAKIIENAVLHDTGPELHDIYVNDKEFNEEKFSLYKKLNKYYGDWIALQLIKGIEPIIEIKIEAGEKIEDDTVSETVSQSEIEMEWWNNRENMGFVLDTQRSAFAINWLPKVK